jgi:hypothetical protein
VLATDDGFFNQNELAIPGILGLVGGCIGGAVGLAIRSDRWEELDPDELRVGVVPTRGGGVAAHVSFGF